MTEAKQTRNSKTYVLTQKGRDKINKALKILSKCATTYNNRVCHEWLESQGKRSKINIEVSGQTIKKVLDGEIAVKEPSINLLFILLFRLLQELGREVAGIDSNGGECGVDYVLQKNLHKAKLSDIEDKDLDETPSEQENTIINSESQTSSFDIIKAQCQNLPSRPYSKFFGREHEINTLLKYLSPDHGQPITVIDGIGGVGKTSLVLETAYRCLFGNVSHLLEGSMGLKRKLISVDKQTDDNIMHHNGFRKANRLSS